MRQRGERDCQGRGRTGVSRCNDERHCGRRLHCLCVLHLQLNRTGIGNAAARYCAGQGIAINRSRGERRVIPKNGCLSRKVRSCDLQRCGLRARFDGLRLNLSDAGGCHLLLRRGLPGSTGCAAETIKKEGGSCTCRDCLKNFAQMTPRGIKLANRSEAAGALVSPLPVTRLNVTGKNGLLQLPERGLSMPLQCERGKIWQVQAQLCLCAERAQVR